MRVFTLQRVRSLLQIITPKVVFYAEEQCHWQDQPVPTETGLAKQHKLQR